MTKKEIADVLKPYNDDIKRHMGALKEDFEDKVQIVAELVMDVKKTVDSHTKTLDSHGVTLNSHTEMIGQLLVDVTTLKQDMQVVKEDVRIIKTDNEQKITYPDFASLEKRVDRLEMANPKGAMR